jgi:methyl-accepting chemotaxis protein
MATLAALFTDDRASSLQGAGAGEREGGFEAIIARLSHDISALAIRLNDVLGNAEHVARESEEGRAAAESLKGSTAQFSRETEELAASMRQIAGTIGDAARGIDATNATIGAALAKTGALTDAVRDASTSLGELQASLAQAAKISGDISSIAMQTNMLALNAAIEAARAGDAGKGFAVVAHEVRLLANKTQSATAQIDRALDSVIASARHLIARGEDNIRVADEVQRDTGAIIDLTATAAADLARIRDEAGQVIDVTSRHEEAFSGLIDVINHVSNALISTATEIGDATDSLGATSEVAEAVLWTLARTGVATDDSPIIAAVRETADAIALAFEEAIDRGEVSMDVLFDDRLRPIEYSDPQQFLARYTSFADRVLPAFQEPLLESDPRIIFACATDRNGYIATHNRRFSQAQGNDPVWNAANSRNRRLFADRVGLAAGRNREPFLLQIYRRDMGGGRYVLMKHVSCPIAVRGQHWGGLRCAFSA